MIGEIVHFTLTNRLASSRPVCHPAIVLGELPNSKLDLLVFLPNVPAVTKPATPKGEIKSVNNWHKLHGEAIA